MNTGDQKDATSISKLIGKNEAMFMHISDEKNTINLATEAFFANVKSSGECCLLVKS